MHFILFLLVLILPVQAIAISPDQLFDEFKFTEALHQYEQKAEAGNSYAQFRTGVQYQLGLGTEQDYEQAIMWYQKAAMQKEGAAMLALGQMYQYGLDTTVSPAESVRKADEWYEKADNESTAGIKNAKERFALAFAQLIQNAVNNINQANTILLQSPAQKNTAVKKLNNAERLLKKLEQSGPPLAKTAKGFLVMLYSTYAKHNIIPLNSGETSRLKQQIESRRKDIISQIKAIQSQ